MNRFPSLHLLALSLALSACTGEAPTITRSAATAAAGSMSVERAVPLAIPLADGRVLVPGGSANGSILSQCDLFDPATGTWTAAAPMAAPREYHTATRLADGRVLVAGGINTVGAVSYTPIASAEIYDPVTGAWSPAASMSTPRDRHGAVRLADGRVLVAGGFGPASAAVQLASAEIYDPGANTWTPTSPPLAGANALVVLLDGRVFAAGPAPSLQLYDPIAELWSEAGPLPAANLFPSPSGGVLVRLADGRVLQSGNGNGSPATWIWNPATGAWSAGAALAHGRNDHGIVLLDDGSVLAVGGRGLDPLASIERYDAASNTWSAEAPLAVPRVTPALVALPGGQALVVGGRNNATGTWASLATAEIVGGAGCTPAPDACAGAQCGILPDGCGGSVSCGSCAPGLACSPQNLCVCLPTTCSAQGKTCGEIPDGCGGALSCGACAPGFACSSANTCVCIPTTCSAQSKTCGQIPDGCGGTLSCGACPAGATCAANVCIAPAGVPVRDAVLGAPRCTVVGPSCDSGTLLVGRGSLGPEAGAPNTLGGTCADGASGTFHSDESLDGLRVISVDGGPLTAGRQVRVDASVWAFSSTNRLDLYSARDAAAPAWTFLATLTPSTSGAQTLSTTFTLPHGGLQAIRGTFRYGGNPGPCTTGSFDDHDDLVFPVVLPADGTPPVVNLASPTNLATVRGNVTVSAIAGDEVGVARVQFLVDGALAFTDDAAPYGWTWNTRTVANGWRLVSARAWDAAGNVSEAIANVWVDNDWTPPNIGLSAPAAGSVVSGTVVVQAAASDDVGVASVEFQVDGVAIGTDIAAPFEAVWFTDSWSAGQHTTTAIARDTAGNSSSMSAVVTVSRTSTTAQYSALLGAPSCNGAVSSCDSGSLFVGRSGLGELNPPNTIDACTDGTYGSFHADESLDRLRVFTLDGGPIAAFKTVRVEATVYPWSTGAYDVLDVWVANLDGSAPVWRFAGSVVPPGAGLRVLTVDVVLTNAPRQAIRGVFRWNGSRIPCPGGYMDDVDDLAFDVQP